MITDFFLKKVENIGPFNGVIQLTIFSLQSYLKTQTKDTKYIAIVCHGFIALDLVFGDLMTNKLSKTC